MLKFPSCGNIFKREKNHQNSFEELNPTLNNSYLKIFTFL